MSLADPGAVLNRPQNFPKSPRAPLKRCTPTQAVHLRPKVFTRPSPLADALSFAEQLRSRPNGVPVAPGARHWSIFRALCVDADTKGSLVADADLAAMAIEAGCEWITTDRDFSRFKGLRWRHPLQ
jgi:uncharacterized protein